METLALIALLLIGLIAFALPWWKEIYYALGLGSRMASPFQTEVDGVAGSMLYCDKWKGGREIVKQYETNMGTLILVKNKNGQLEPFCPIVRGDNLVALEYGDDLTNPGVTAYKLLGVKTPDGWMLMPPGQAQGNKYETETRLAEKEYEDQWRSHTRETKEAIEDFKTSKNLKGVADAVRQIRGGQGGGQQ